MRFPRMPIEAEAPEQLGYERIRANLTESSVRDRSLDELGLELGGLSLCYSEHHGHPGLRALVAEAAGAPVLPADVLLSAGASSALFTVAMALLEPGRHMIVVRPNYGTNLETPRGLGCAVDLIDLRFEDGYALDPARVRALLRPDTRLVSITTPHNPTGVGMTLAALHEIVRLCEAQGTRLLVDETYRDLSFVEPLPVAAGLSPNAISVSSMSKAYGLPGIRLGWAICRDPALMHELLCVKEQVGICGSVLDEAVGFHAYAARASWLAENGKRVRQALDTVRAWMAGEPRLEWVEPQGGCVCFPRIRADARVDTDRFYRTLAERHGTYVGPGHWFEQSDRSFRIGYGWPTPAELAHGLASISSALGEAAG